MTSLICKLFDGIRVRTLVSRAFLSAALAAHASHGSAQDSPDHAHSAETIAPGEATSFDLASLEMLALERNPTLVQAGAQVTISRGAAIQAGLYPNPTAG